MNEQEKFFKTKNLQNKIKGVGCLVILLFIFIAIISNSNNSKPAKVNNTENKNISTNVQTEAQNPVFKKGDHVVLGNIVITVNEVKDCVAKYLKPEAGQKYISIDVLQENVDGAEVSHNPLYFTLQDNKDFTYPITFKGCQDPAFGTGILQKGQKTRGFLTFEIPKENSPSQLIFKPNLWSTDQLTVQLK